MKIYSDINLREFTFWGSADEVAAEFTDRELDEIQAALEVEYPDGLTENELNDLFRFDEDYIANLAGYSSFENVRIGRTIEDEEWDKEYEEEFADIEEEDESFRRYIEQKRHEKIY